MSEIYYKINHHVYKPDILLIATDKVHLFVFIFVSLQDRILSGRAFFLKDAL